jgi:hypothetical protein
MTEKITIDSLFTDGGAFDEESVIKALQRHVTIQRKTNRIYFKESRLSVDKKILAFGLAKKLLESKGLLESEMLTAVEFQESTGIKKGTVDPAFKNLKDKGFLVGKRKYEISNHKIPVAVALLNNSK